MHRLALVRAPFTYRYNDLDVREEVILSQLTDWLAKAGVEARVFDFHLARDTRAEDLLATDPTAIIIAVRETGDNVHYALRLATLLTRKSRAKIILYGQTARLAGHPQLPDGAIVVRHSEAELAHVLGLADPPPAFDGALRIAPYHDRLPLTSWQRTRLRGSIETTRGCPYPCAFCFINAGANHDRRWQRQSIEATLSCLRAYTTRGVNAFVFHDSEFIGGSPRDLKLCSGLAAAIRAELPDILFKIYARADTLLKYPDLGGLVDAGLVSVFMGVESLVQSDLDALDKALDARTTLAAIDRLADHGVYMDLSFILFNRATTPATLRQNLTRLLELYGSRHARLLGMPHFAFSFESAWKGSPTRKLSRRTYVDWDVRVKMPIVDGAVFDARLEPLMEIYRLLAYEWSKKVIELNHARDGSDAATQAAIESWFNGLGIFCAHTMLAFLDEFEDGRLTIAGLEDARERLFARIEHYYRALPPRLAAPATFETHASALNYDREVDLVEADEYWLRQIPDPALEAALGASA